MKTRLTLRPGQNGTKKLQLEYGGRLLYVRYRYDEERQLRYKTVELIVEQQPWVPVLSSRQDPNEPVYVRVGYEEAELRQVVKSAGGRWDQGRRMWQMRIGAAYRLGVQARIVR